MPNQAVRRIRSVDISHTSPHITSNLQAAPYSGGAPARKKAHVLPRVIFKKQSTKRRALRLAIVSSNLVVLAAVVGFFVLQPRFQSDQSSLVVANEFDESSLGPLDQLSSANIALTVARMGNLPETVAITNQADSEDVSVNQAATENSTISSKPQVVASSFKSAQDVETYTVVDGDSVASIASKFGVTSDSIRWSNNLTGTGVAVGTQLTIPPVNGIVYTVSGGENADTIATKFSADKAKLIAFNDAELTGFVSGQKIVIPGGTKAAPRAATAITAASVRGLKAVYGYNGYDYGYCTWYVASVRSIPAGLGNAATWGIRARAMGLETGTVPRVGAAVVTSTRGAGHVAYVEAVNDDGTIWVSEMNSRGQVSMTDSSPAGGWGRRDFKVISAAGKTYVY